MAATSSITPSSSSSNNTHTHNTNHKTDAKFLKHKRRLCQVEGCIRIVKSQGRCQRHGAKPKLCHIAGCTKQAQGNFDGMCKAHFHQKKQAFTTITNADGSTTTTTSAAPAIAIPDPTLTHLSVYDHIIPASIRWVPHTGTPFPLVHHLQTHFHKGTAWHRNEERVARGVPPVTTPATQLLGWERELVWTEILLLTGHPHTTFRHLARAWGRDKGFHRVLAQFICQRQGSVERKQQQGKAGMMPMPTMTTTTEMMMHPEQPTTCVPIVASTAPALYASTTTKKTTPSSFAPGPLAAATSTNHTTAASTATTSDEDEQHTAANIWDSACYYGMEYNEALAASLFDGLAPEDDEEDEATTSACSSSASMNEEPTTNNNGTEQQQNDSS